MSDAHKCERHDYKWLTIANPEGWYCIHCGLRWEDDPEHQPITPKENNGSEN